MTGPQRARRLRQIAARLGTLAAEQRRLDAEARTLENEHSRSLGLLVPVRGDRLLREMDRRSGDARIGRNAKAVQHG